MSLIARSTAAALLGAVFLVSAPAHAQEAAAAVATGAAPSAELASAPKAECVGHLDQAQSLQTARKLREARASYVVTLDPGAHVVRFERAGGGVSEVRIVAREGEKKSSPSSSAAPVSSRSGLVLRAPERRLAGRPPPQLLRSLV